ncbi:MAG: phosphoglycerate mutase family protein [Steroidobacteraceae bacterium]
MTAPPAASRRRPFLAPLWIALIAAIAAVALAVAIWRNARVTTFVVARQAEKPLGTIEDAPLAPPGELRAQRLAQLLSARGPGRIAAIYAVDPQRTRQTVSAVESRLGLLASVENAPDPAELAARIERAHAGGSVLIVAPPPFVTALVRALSQDPSVPVVGESDYDVVYVVSVPAFGHPSLLRLSY